MRRTTTALVGMTLLTTLVLVLANPVVAQTACPATLALSHDAPSTFEPNGVRDVTFTVANEDAFAEVLVTVRTQVPEGWTVDPREREVAVGPGESVPVAFTVTASGNPGESAQMNAQAVGVCSANGLPFPIADAARTPQVTDTLVLETTVPPRLPWADLAAIPPQYFLGGLGLVAVVVGAVFAMQRSHAGFQVGSPEPEKTLRAGRGTSFPIELKNRGREPDTAHFEVGDVPSGWNAFMALPELTLAGGESRTLWLMVRAPPDATPDSSAVITISVRSGDHPKQAHDVVVRAVVQEQAPGAGDAADAGTLPG